MAGESDKQLRNGSSMPRLVWPGKLDDEYKDERLTKPLATPRYREIYGSTLNKHKDSINQLFLGDNLQVMAALSRHLRASLDLIYIDPPFATGSNFSWVSKIGSQQGDGREHRSLAFSDRWTDGLVGFLSMLHPRLRWMHRLLAPQGSFYIHVDATVSHAVKLLLDEIFGPECFQREIIWRIGWISGFKTQAKNWIRNHDVILFYTKHPRDFTFHKHYIPYPEGYRRRDGKLPKGQGIPIDDVWNSNESEFHLRGKDSLDSIQIKSFSREKTGWATQKNESLLRRIILASSNPGDIVADFFCGSGTTLAVAQNLQRRWIGCDLSSDAVHIAHKRLLEIKFAQQDEPGFELLKMSQPAKQTMLESSYLPILHKWMPAKARKDTLEIKECGQDLVFFGIENKTAVFASPQPYTFSRKHIAKVVQIIEEEKCQRVVILAWNWQISVAYLHRKMFRKRALPLQIVCLKSKEMVEIDQQKATNFEFQERPMLELGWSRINDRVDVVIKNYQFFAHELLPEAICKHVHEWSDFIDFWAIDFDCSHEDRFCPNVVAFRTHHDRQLAIRSEQKAYTYPGPGIYIAKMKIVDILGNKEMHCFRVQLGAEQALKVTEFVPEDLPEA